MNYQWRMNTMVGDERDLKHELQSGKSHRRDTRKRSKHRSKFRRRCQGLGRWCSKCCRRQEDTDSDSIKSDASFFKRRRRKKRKRIENREEVEDEDEDETSEDHASSEASGVLDRVSDEDLPREKRRKSRRKRRKLRRSSEDSLFKASEEAEDQEREEELEVLEATTAETSHHHAHKYYKNDHHRKSDEKPKHLPTSQEFDYDSRKVEKARKRHGARRKLDFEKSCCYICARNSMAIAAAKTSNCHRPSQVSSHAFQPGEARKETCDKSCNPILNVRTVQSWVRVRTCDKCTIFPESKKKDKAKHKSKYKKFGIFPKVKLTKCPATRTVACETDRCGKQDDKKRHNQKHERCCGERKPNRF